MSTVTVKKKRKTPAAKRNLIWDIVIGLGFLLVFSQEITGETLHEWLALALFAGLITHVVLHWKWVVNVTKRIFNPKLNRKTRLSYLVVVGLMVSFFFMGVSGLLISESVMPAFGLPIGADTFEDLHEAASNATLILVGVHLLQHWKWIVTNSKKYIRGRYAK